MVASTNREYYTVPEAARLLQVSPSTIWRWINSEKLRAYRVGPRNIRIRKEDLRAILSPTSRIKSGVKKMRSDFWAGYSPEAVLEALDLYAGTWNAIDAEALIAELFRAREEGSRPVDRL